MRAVLKESFTFTRYQYNSQTINTGIKVLPMFKSKRVVKLGELSIGGKNTVSVQSMTNSQSFEGLKVQIKDLEDIGCDIVRISVPNEEQFQNFFKLKEIFTTPLIADIHFDYQMAIKCIESGALGVRINPGNIGAVENYFKILEIAKLKDTCIRIGVNSGSLEKEILEKHNGPTALALLESTLKWIELTEKFGFYNFKVSIKSSDIETLIKANEMLFEKTLAPIHLGLTEAGTLISGLVKSSLALSPLLKKGIGDTIRISLSANPVDEVIAAIELLKALNLREGVDIISCPTCARTSFDVIETANFLQKRYSKVRKNLKVAVMGCIVNGPGEGKEADIGIAGSKTDVLLFKKGVVVGNISLEQAFLEIDKFINSEGV